jgi:broad specificity phosphatase PhoE
MCARPTLAEQGATRPPESRQPRTLVLVRHGETDWNAQERAQGHADVPLNTVGRVQAATVAPVLADLEPVRLWSSDLARAMQTAEFIAAATGLAIEPDPRLREYDVGMRSGLTREEFAAMFPQEYAAWLANDSSHLVPGEESSAQVHDRVVPALAECLAALSWDQTGIVVMHGACLKVGLMGLLGWPWELAGSLQGPENCGYCVLTEHDDRGRVRLTSYNEKAVGARHGPDFATDGPVG